jgi:hypothetical protein
VSNELRGTVLKVGPHAMSRVKPRQARKGATVRRSARVPGEYLTGAGSALRSRDGRFEGGCTVIWFRGGAGAAPPSGSPTALNRARRECRRLFLDPLERAPLLPRTPPLFLIDRLAVAR